MKLNVPAGSTWPSNVPSLFGRVPDVTVCLVLSLFVQVTFAPVATSSVAGNLKPWMSMATPAAAGAGVAGAAAEPHAAVSARIAASAVARWTIAGMDPSWRICGRHAHAPPPHAPTPPPPLTGPI